MIIRAAVLFVILSFAACSASDLEHQDSRHYQERAAQQSAGGLKVTAAALSLSESQKVFGVPLNLVGIQPVWIEVQNDTPHTQWLFPHSVDEDYFPPYEVARRVRGAAQVAEGDLFRRLTDLQIASIIPPDAKAGGFVYTHDDEGMKAFDVDLHGHIEEHKFHFVMPVPGLPSDYFDPEERMQSETVGLKDLDLDGLRSWLEQLPCCTVNRNGAVGDPLNVVLVGGLEEVRANLISRHWDVTAPVSASSVRRTISAFLFGSRYRYAPISALYLFEREHDLAFQKARAVVDERNHMRLWLAPVTLEGMPVWVGQISRDDGIKFSRRFWPPTTHVVDPDMDDARFYLMQDLFAARAVSRVGFVKGHAPADIDRPHRNAERDPYFTDGLRAVFFVAGKPISIPTIELLDWELPPSLLPYREEFVIDGDASQ